MKSQPVTKFQFLKSQSVSEFQFMKSQLTSKYQFNKAVSLSSGWFSLVLHESEIQVCKAGYISWPIRIFQELQKCNTISKVFPFWLIQAKVHAKYHVKDTIYYRDV